jgi:hypothetical protein
MPVSGGRLIPITMPPVIGRDTGDHARDGGAAGICGSGAIGSLSYRGADRHRRRPAAQSGEISEWD